VGIRRRAAHDQNASQCGGEDANHDSSDLDRKLRAWLEGRGNSPRERALKSRLRYARVVKVFGERDLVDLVAVMGQHASEATMLAAFDQHLPVGQAPSLDVRISGQ